MTRLSVYLQAYWCSLVYSSAHLLTLLVNFIDIIEIVHVSQQDSCLDNCKNEKKRSERDSQGKKRHNVHHRNV